VIEGQQIVTAPPVAGERVQRPKNLPAPIVTTGGPPRVETLRQVSQAYRPITYGELVPTGGSSVVNGNLKEGNSLQFGIWSAWENRFPYLNFDLSGFYFTFDDQVGEIILPNGFTSTSNIGDARYIGFESRDRTGRSDVDQRWLTQPVRQPDALWQRHLLDAEFHFRPEQGQHASIRSKLPGQDRRDL